MTVLLRLESIPAMPRMIKLLVIGCYEAHSLLRLLAEDVYGLEFDSSRSTGSPNAVPLYLCIVERPQLKYATRCTDWSLTVTNQHQQPTPTVSQFAQAPRHTIRALSKLWLCNYDVKHLKATFLGVIAFLRPLTTLELNENTIHTPTSHHFNYEDHDTMTSTASSSLISKPSYIAPKPTLADTLIRPISFLVDFLDASEASRTTTKRRELQRLNSTELKQRRELYSIIIDNTKRDIRGHLTKGEATNNLKIQNCQAHIAGLELEKRVADELVAERKLGKEGRKPLWRRYL